MALELKGLKGVELVVPRFQVKRGSEEVDKAGPHKSLSRKPVLARRTSLKDMLFGASASTKLNEPADVKRASIVSLSTTEVVVRPVRSVSASYVVEPNDGPSDRSSYERRAVSASLDHTVRRPPQRRRALLLNSAKRMLLRALEPLRDEEEAGEKDQDVEEQKEEELFMPKRALPLMSSPFLAESLYRLTAKPFRRPVFGKYNPREISHCLEDVYAPMDAVLRALPIKYTRNDVIVCSPLRTGQTPVLQTVAAMLMHKKGTNPDTSIDCIFGKGSALLDRVGSPGSRLSHLPKLSFERPDRKEPMRLFRTHMSLRFFIRPRNEHSMQYLRLDAPRIIVPLRDPCRVTESWFRHLSQVFESFEGKSFPFGQADFKAFCPGSFHALNFEKGEEYERFIMAALECAKLPNILILFYEDILLKPDMVVRAIAQFLQLDVGEDCLNRIVLELQRGYRREGLRLEPVFSDEFLAFVNQRWVDEVKYQSATVEGKRAAADDDEAPPQTINNYYELYEHLTGRTYPLERFGAHLPLIEPNAPAAPPRREPSMKAPRLSSLLFSKRT